MNFMLQRKWRYDIKFILINKDIIAVNIELRWIDEEPGYPPNIVINQPDTFELNIKTPWSDKLYFSKQEEDGSIIMLIKTPEKKSGTGEWRVTVHLINSGDVVSRGPISTTIEEDNGNEFLIKGQVKYRD